MSNIKVSVGRRIRDLRRVRGFSQEALALESGLDRTYINSVENGRRNLSIINLEKIAISLRVSLRSFFDNDLFDN